MHFFNLGDSYMRRIKICLLLFARKINPNWLTVTRLIFLAPLVFALLCLDNHACLVWCFVAMWLAEVTDFFDGIIARTTNQVTDFGKIFDPLCDSIYHNLIWLAFSFTGWSPFYLMPIFIVRDQVVAYIRVYLAKNNIILSARWSGKVKAFSQATAQMVIVLMHLIWRADQIIQIIQFWLVVLAALITLWSLYDYFKEFCKKVDVGLFFKKSVF